MIINKVFIVLNECNYDFKSNNYYCYELINPATDMPFYVGKGTKFRFGQHKYHYKDVSHNKHKTNTVGQILAHHEHVPVKIVHQCSSESEAYEKEAALIQHYGTIYDGTGILTNLTKGGCGAPASTQTPIVQYNLYGEYIQTFANYHDAAASVSPDNYETVAKQILECCRGVICTCRDFYWSYGGDYILKPRTKIIPVVQMTLNGEDVRRFTSAAEAGRALQIDGRDIQAAIKRSGICNGSRWRHQLV